MDLQEVGCGGMDWILVQPTDIHARNVRVPSAAFGAPPEDEQVMLETCRGP
jgi:hypothetical protein